MILSHARLDYRTRAPAAVFVGLAIATLTLAACTGAQASPAQIAATTQAEPSAQASTGDLTQSAEAGAVTVTITPLNLATAEGATLDFNIAMNTHSVDLGADLTRLSVIRVGNVELAAKTWQPMARGGHHVQGTLSFPAKTATGQPLLAGATAVSVTIRDLADVPDRTFTWNLGQSKVAQ